MFTAPAGLSSCQKLIDRFDVNNFGRHKMAAAQFHEHFASPYFQGIDHLMMFTLCPFVLVRIGQRIEPDAVSPLRIFVYRLCQKRIAAKSKKTR